MNTVRHRPSLHVAVVTVLALATALLVAPGPGGSTAAADVSQPGFRQSTALSGLNAPTAVRFAGDGRVFVAEKRGVIKVFDGLGDTTPTVFADLRTEVFNGADRGLLGLEIDPSFPARPYVYALYTRDALPGGEAPRWGSPGVDSDGCPSPPGYGGQGCVVTGRLSRLTADGDRMSESKTLITDWCQQFSSHSVGSLAFGPDGALYATGGDGASFNYVDYGQTGNPCGDPPGSAGTGLTSPTGQGGALRSQDVRTQGDPTGLDGTVIRVDPDTGEGRPGNPFAGSADANARRIIAYGLRNPYRLTMRPGTDQAWLGDVGWNRYEELDRIADVDDGVAENFGWPCLEGPGERTGYADLNMCSSLYASGGATGPAFAYQHKQPAVPGGDACTNDRGSSTTGVAFYRGGSYPSSYDGAVFFADSSRGCVYAMLAGDGGAPDPATVRTFVTDAGAVVDLQIGPGGDLFLVDLYGGTVRRISYFSDNTPPTAVATATPRTGAAPLTVTLDAGGSRDPDPGDTLSFAWDLDGDGAFDDATGASLTRTYEEPARVTVVVQVTDSRGAVDTASVVVTANNTPPVPVITSPDASLRWAVDDTITFSGGAEDRQDGTLGAAALSWSLVLQHCPSGCHAHVLRTLEGVSGGTLSAPDHEMPARLELRLTATDSEGLFETTTVEVLPRTVELTVASDPPGLSLAVGGDTGTAPLRRTAIVGSGNSVSAPATQTLDGRTYAFDSWSDGGAAAHNITAPGSDLTLTARYRETSTSCPAGSWRGEYFSGTTLSGPATVRCAATPGGWWGTGSPAGVPVGPDDFSTRFTRTRSYAAGTYTWTATSDDGVRVFVDGVKVLDNWSVHTAQTVVATRTLPAGNHTVVVEHFDRAGPAVLRLTETAVTTSCGTRWRAEYFPNSTLSGTPSGVRCENAVNYAWGTGGPTGVGVGRDGFSVRWTRQASFPTTSARFTTTADDGMRVYVDGALKVGRWTGPSGATTTVTKPVPTGEHTVQVDYVERTGQATAKVSWS